MRTKLRPVPQQHAQQAQRATLLEACVENCTARPLLLAGVRFDAAPGVAARPVAAGGGEGTPGAAPASYADSIQVRSGPVLVICQKINASCRAWADSIGAVCQQRRQAVQATHQREHAAQVINAGGSSTFLYLLTGALGGRAGPGAASVGGALGKLDIRCFPSLGCCLQWVPCCQRISAWRQAWVSLHLTIAECHKLCKSSAPDVPALLTLLVFQW